MATKAKVFCYQNGIKTFLIKLFSQNKSFLRYRPGTYTFRVSSTAWSFNIFKRLPIKPLPVVLSISLWSKKSDTPAQSDVKAPEKSKEELLVEQADELYSKDDTLALYLLLVPYKDTDNPDVLWRLARATCDKGKLSDNVNDKKACMFEAFEYIKKALQLTDTNFAVHKWYAILLDYTAEYEGTERRIKNAYIAKEHFKKALELNPKDATTIYSLGYWCFLFADLPWIQKKLAAAIYATPPTSTYEEALEYFLKAEETDPNFYSTNLLMIGKTYMRMKKNDLAIQFLKRARDAPIKKPDDKKAHKEAIDLLKSLGVKE